MEGKYTSFKSDRFLLGNVLHGIITQSFRPERLLTMGFRVDTSYKILLLISAFGTENKIGRH